VVTAVSPQTDGGDPVRLTAFVRGRVQGVGFRWWTRAQALELGLAGHARNLPDGRVEVVAEGPRTQVGRLLDRIQGAQAGRPGHVDGVVVRWDEPTGRAAGFTER
jgi:acylphosphatase